MCDCRGKKFPKGHRTGGWVNLEYHRPGNCKSFGMTRILLVEDSADILFVLQTELEWMGYTVAANRDAVAAIETARASRPDVIVSDLQMPIVDGYEFIRRIRAIPDLADVPAIALTGFSSSKEVQLALNSGFSACLTKPVDGKTLSDMIVRVSGKRFKKAS
jgi:two-component system, chemotaxis family, CheB/CheR fusion protein